MFANIGKFEWIKGCIETNKIKRERTKRVLYMLYKYNRRIYTIQLNRKELTIEIDIRQ